MNKLAKFAALALLVCGCVIPRLSAQANFSMNWCSLNSSYIFVEVEVPGACTVSTYISAVSEGGEYYYGGSSGIWYIWTFFPLLHNPQWLYPVTVTSPQVYAFRDGPSLPDPVWPNRASVWVNVWGGGNSYSRGEFKCSDYVNVPGTFFEYGQATAGHYYIDINSQIQGAVSAAYAYVIVDITW